MSRSLIVAAGQLGPVERADGRAAVMQRLIALLEQASAAGCALVVFPEMALTPFFPRRLVEDRAELDSYFESEMPGPQTEVLFETAARLGIGFVLGYCERALEGEVERFFNSEILVGNDGAIIGKYRKVHLPGTCEPLPGLPYQHMEPRYFEDGDLGFPVWQAFGTTIGLAICNDRRWPESYRLLRLAGAELVLLGYNTPAKLPAAPWQDELRGFHHLLPMQAGAYQNSLWVVAAAKAGLEEGVEMLAQSCVIAPSGEITALASGSADELVVAEVDLELAARYRQFLDLEGKRRPEVYGPIAAPKA